MNVVTKIIAVFLAVTVMVSMTGCAYHHPNPILRDASYGATVGAVPGLALMALTPEAGEADSDDIYAFFGLSLLVLGAGAVAGLAIGSVVGVFHWMYQTATWKPPEETVIPVETQSETSTVQQVDYETAQEPTAVRQETAPAVEGPAAVEMPATEPSENVENPGTPVVEPAASAVEPTALQQNESPATAQTEGEGDYMPQAVRQEQ